ncbi:MAG: protein jag [Clostridiales bacterium]|jgi:spoIIIJ-associated protein|nr:protein jag [Clostridiales bacterium]
MSSIEMTGKTIDDALADALKKLGVTKDKVEIIVLDAGSKGILGLGSRPAKIKVTVQADPESVAKNFLREVTVAIGLDVEVETKSTEKRLYVNMKGEDIGVLIGKHGQTLDSLQYLLNLIINKGTAPYLSVTLDTENYRQRRKDTLETLARNLAKKAKITRKKVMLEPMSPYERRIIHSALQGDKRVDTYSEGVEPSRYVVIVSKP